MKGIRISLFSDFLKAYCNSVQRVTFRAGPNDKTKHHLYVRKPQMQNDLLGSPHFFGIPVTIVLKDFKNELTSPEH